MDTEEGDYIGELGLNERIILKLMWKKWSVRMWIGFVWFRVRSDGFLLWTR